MASVRKTYTRSKPAQLKAPSSERAEKTCFINDVITGTIQATKVIEVRTPQGKLIRLEYDDPDGNSGAGKGGAGTRGNSLPLEDRR